MQLVSYRKAITLLKEGSLLLYPTETLYALGGSCLFPLQKAIFKLKNRSKGKPLPLIAHSVQQIRNYASLTPYQQALWYCFPHITQVLPTQKKYYYLGESIAVRLAVTPLLQKLTFFSPLFSTSANISGASPTSSIKHLDPSISQHVSICLPLYKNIPCVHSLSSTSFLSSALRLSHAFTSPPLPSYPTSQKPSTIVEFKNNVLHLIREGTISKQHLIDAGFFIA